MTDEACRAVSIIIPKLQPLKVLHKKCELYVWMRSTSHFMTSVFIRACLTEAI